MAKVATTDLTVSGVPFGEEVTAGDLVGWSNNQLMLASGAAGAAIAAAGVAAAAYKSGDRGAIHLLGEVSGFTGLTVGTTLYLSLDVPGSVQAMAPSGPGNLKQVVGYAVAPDRIVFMPQDRGTVL